MGLAERHECGEDLRKAATLRDRGGQFSAAGTRESVPFSRVHVIKSVIRRVLVNTGLRELAEPAHDKLTQLLLWSVQRLEEVLEVRATVPERLADVTAIIKTFERPAVALRLVASIRSLFPGLKMVIADDSRIPLSLPGIEVVGLPFDTGVSLGRQAALERVRTEFTWVLDDDFVLYSGTQLDLVLSALANHPVLDIVGGPVINLPLWLKRRADPNGIYPTPSKPVMRLGARFDEVEVCDKVPNFFVGRTERLKLIGWTPELRRLDHADFFTRARGTLVTAYCDSFRCLHAQTPFDRNYQRYRQDLASDRQILKRRYRLLGE